MRSIEAPVVPIHEAINVPISKINEEEAIGRGAMALYDIYDESFVAVSTGTGTACIHHSNSKFNYLGGISVGGGTLQGLSKYLISTENAKILRNWLKKEIEKS